MSDSVFSGASDRAAALTNNKGPNQSNDISGDLIGGENSERTGLEETGNGQMDY